MGSVSTRAATQPQVSFMRSRTPIGGGLAAASDAVRSSVMRARSSAVMKRWSSGL